jgi:hypothetical protein
LAVYSVGKIWKSSYSELTALSGRLYLGFNDDFNGHCRRK